MKSYSRPEGRQRSISVYHIKPTAEERDKDSRRYRTLTSHIDDTLNTYPNTSKFTHTHTPR